MINDLNIQSPQLQHLYQRLLIYNTPKSNSHTNLYTNDHQVLIQNIQQTPMNDASVLVALTNESNPKLLLTHRAGHLHSHAGEVAFSGGKREIEDTDNIMTALRESHEELALSPKQVTIIGQLPTQTSKSGLTVRPIVALINPNVTLVANDEEIERIFWVDFEWLRQQPTMDYQVSYSINGKVQTFVTPSWQIDGEVIWGLTGRIIASLLEIGFDKKFKWGYRLLS